MDDGIAWWVKPYVALYAAIIIATVVQSIRRFLAGGTLEEPSLKVSELSLPTVLRFLLLAACARLDAATKTEGRPKKPD